MRNIILLIFCVYSYTVNAQWVTPFQFIRHNAEKLIKTTAPANTKFIWFLGQSNATGNELVSGMPSYLSGPLTGCYILNINTGVIETLQAGVNNRCMSSDKSQNLKFGIELQLMKTLDSVYSTPQYMVKYTEPGTQLGLSGSSALLDWNIASDYPVELYPQAFDYYNRALLKMPINLVPNWLVWMQGENDAQSSTLYNAYQTNLTNLINSYRLASGSGTALKVVLVSLSATGQTSLNATGVTAVNLAMLNISGSLTNVYYYSQNNATIDGTHYSTQSYVNIAKGVAAIIQAH